VTGRLENRVIKLEGGARSGWRTWEDRPVDEWPDEALLALLAESQGWPLGRKFTDEELDEELVAIVARSEAARPP
jgi:hypothetical protein